MVSFERASSTLAALLLALVSWLSARTLEKLDSVSDQVQVVSISLQQVPALSAALRELSATVREQDRRLTIIEARGLVVTPLANRQ